MGLTLLLVQVVFGALIASFALSRTFWVSNLLLFAAGACLLCVFSMTASLVQLIVPDHLRGRVMLTARGEEADRISGLEQGADDYVTKPFSPKELTARVNALLRRLTRPATALARYGSITIDPDRHQVTLDGEDVRLTAKEFLLLQYLVQHRGRVLSRDLLLSDVWGYHYTGGTRTVDVHVRRLREKLPVLADAIETIKQFGYKLADRP